MKICLDAGHYGKYNKSPVDAQYYESDAMWKLHLMQKKYLEEYGAEVVLYGDVYDEACACAYQMAEEQGYTFVHPFDDLDVATGQGTIAMEII